MSPNPAPFLQHLKTQKYHPRSNAHSNSLAECIVADLVAHCPAMKQHAASGSLVYEINFTLHPGTSEWNVDLVLGRPGIDAAPLLEAGLIIERARPSTVLVAIEIKSVMTEHHKAVKNRKRDLEAHHDHVHRYRSDAIAGGVLVINGAQTFRSPLRPETTTHRNPDDLVRHCLSELRAVASRSRLEESGLDAKCAVVLDIDNENPTTFRYLTRSPAPQTGDPLHYDAFVQTVCALYERRFGDR